MPFTTGVSAIAVFNINIKFYTCSEGEDEFLMDVLETLLIHSGLGFIVTRDI
jgi:hypothetical protein